MTPVYLFHVPAEEVADTSLIRSFRVDGQPPVCRYQDRCWSTSNAACFSPKSVDRSGIVTVTETSACGSARSASSGSGMNDAHSGQTEFGLASSGWAA